MSAGIFSRSNASLHLSSKGSVLPHLSIGPIGQLAHFFFFFQRYVNIDKLINWFPINI